MQKQPSHSRITRLEIKSILAPAFGGYSFGDTGPYEFVVATAYGEADPKSKCNAAVTDLVYAPSNVCGLVEYNVDVAVLRPMDSSRSNRTLLYEVVNRGRKLLLPTLLGNRSTCSLTEVPPQGTKGILARGFTVAWSGWQADFFSTHADDGSGVMGARFPAATAISEPITGWVNDEFVLDGLAGATIEAIPLDATFFDAPLTYPPCSEGTAGLRLFVRANGTAQRIELPISMLQRTGYQQVRVELDPRFDRGAIYEIHYLARDPKIAGLSFVSIRDLVAGFKYGFNDAARASSPLSGSVDRAVGFGLSQSGRFLREFLYLDFNIDEKRRRVFDGVIPIGAGAKRGFFHQRFAQPHRSPQLQRQSHDYPGAEFPFAYILSKDTVSGREDSVLRKPLESNSCPRVMHIDGDMEQWQQAGCLLFPQSGALDEATQEYVRAYLLAGSPHSVCGGMESGVPERLELCEYPINSLSWAPVLRALICRMKDWIDSGKAPPPSIYPSLNDPARVSIIQLAELMPYIPGFAFHHAHGKIDVLDHDEFPPKVRVANAYPIRVMRVNIDGNPFDGVLLPELRVPIATYSGRNLRRSGTAAGDLFGTIGSAIPFAPSRDARIASGDARASIEERYANEAQYRELLQAAAHQLVAAGLMLREDVAYYGNYRLPPNRCFNRLF